MPKVLMMMKAAKLGWVGAGKEQGWSRTRAGEEQDGVVDRWRELPPGLERHGDVGQDATALQNEGATGAHRGELSVPHRIAWQPGPGDRQVRRVGARMTGLVDGGPVTAHPFVRHEVGLLTGRTPALCADSGTRRPAGGHFVALPGHIPTVAGE